MGYKITHTKKRKDTKNPEPVVTRKLLARRQRGKGIEMVFIEGKKISLAKHNNKQNTGNNKHHKADYIYYGDQQY
jgi:hypothetical protein